MNNMNKTAILPLLRLIICGFLVLIMAACSSLQSEDEYTGMKMNEQLIRALAAKKPADITDLGDLVSYIVPFQKRMELMNDQGEVVLSLEITNKVPQVSYFQEGVAVVKTSEGIAFINSQGEFVIPFGKYDDASLLANGIIMVSRNGRYGIVNTKDEEVIPIRYIGVCTLGCDIYMQKDNFSYEVFDKEGNLLRTIKEVEIIGLKEDSQNNLLFAVIREDNRFFFLDKDRKTIQLDVDYVATDTGMDNLPELSVDEISGLISVRKNGKLGYINTKGEMVIPCEYEHTPYIDNDNGRGFILKKNGKYGVLDYDGTVIWPFDSDSEICGASKSYKIGILSGSVNGSRYFIKPRKTWQTDTIKWQFGNILGDYVEAILEDDNGSYRYGIANGNGELVVPCMYYEEFSYDKKFNIAYIESDGWESCYYDLNDGAKKIWDGVNVNLRAPIEHFYKGVDIVCTKEGFSVMRKNGSVILQRDDYFIKRMGASQEFFIAYNSSPLSDYSIHVVDVDGNDILKLEYGVYKKSENFLDGFYFVLENGVTYFITGEGDVITIEDEFVTSQNIKRD